MSWQGLTPEALVTRTDSKNPATTCKGLTVSGRPCRRGLAETSASSPYSSPGTSPNKHGNGNSTGVVAILNEGDAAAFFCWQHKDQAENLVASMKQQFQKEGVQRSNTRIVHLTKRSSIDTLAEKFGVLELDADSTVGPQRVPEAESQQRRHRVRNRHNLPPEWQGIEGPLMSVPEEVMQEAVGPGTPSRPPHRKSSPTSRPKKAKPVRSNVKASWGCCIRADDDYDDDGPPPRRRERHEHRNSSTQVRPQSSRRPSHSTRPVETTQTQPQMQERVRPRSQHYSDHSDPNHLSQSRTPRRSEQYQQQQQQLLTPTRPSPRPPSTATHPHSQTQNFLSYIPPHLDPSTTSSLLSELSKPFAKDDEAGYIYIFWLTPTSQPDVPDDDIASTILDGDLDDDDDQSQSKSQSRRVSQQITPNITNTTTATTKSRTHTLHRYATTTTTTSRTTSPPTSPGHKSPARPKILLKIGRAQNVHRRMTQWTKQCNQNITLVRYYPHHPSNATHRAQSSPTGAKVAHVNRVERLIHLELRGLGMGKEKEGCVECGREHREWFEVEASLEGLRGVDSVVRRWVGWAQSRT